MTTMTQQPVTVPAEPATERRGGTRPDWDRTRPGEELPEKDDGEKWDPPGNPEDDCDMGLRAEYGTPGLAKWCGRPGCGGD